MINPTSKIKVSSTVTSVSLKENLLLVTSTDKKFRVLDLVSEKCITEIEGHGLGINQGIWDQFGEYIFTASDDATIKLWNKHGKAVSTFIGHSHNVQTIAVDNKNLMLLSGGNDCSVFLWDVRSSKAINTLFHVHQESVTSLAFCEDSSVFLTGSFDGTIHLWDTMSLNSLKTCSFNRNIPVSKAKFIGNYIYCACLDSKILLWDASEVKSIPIKNYVGHYNESYSCECLAFKNGRIYSGTENGEVVVWDLNNCEILDRFQMFKENRKEYIGVVNTFDIENDVIAVSSFDPSDLVCYEDLLVGKIC